MQELMLMFAEIMPTTEIVKSVNEASAEYLADPSKENLTKVQMYCALMLAKEAVEKQGLKETMRGMEQVSKFKEMFNQKS